MDNSFVILLCIILHLVGFLSWQVFSFYDFDSIEGVWEGLLSLPFPPPAPSLSGVKNCLGLQIRILDLVSGGV